MNYCVGLDRTASEGHHLHCFSNFPNVTVVDSCSKYDLHAIEGYTIDNGNVLKKQGGEGIGNLQCLESIQDLMNLNYVPELEGG